MTYVLLFGHACVATDGTVKSRRDAEDSNALILAPADKVEEDSDVPAIKAPKLSKSQLRKQKKVHEEVQKRQQRAQVCFIQRTNDYVWNFVHSSPRLPDPLLGENWQKSCLSGSIAHAGVRYVAAACAVRLSACPHHASTHAWPV